jgi:lipopolysaccharide export system protein LptA
MRTTEAARYARWSVTVAAMLALMVISVYAWRAWQARQAQTTAPPPVPPAVQQRSAEFTFSKVEGNSTRFIVRASHATEFKEGGRTLLEDVWITTFGGDGKRSDQLHTPTCEYFAESGMVTCPKQVLIDLQSNSSPAAASGPVGSTASGAVHIVTSHLVFNRETGMATSDDPVQFEFAEGEGHAIGLAYDSQRGELHLLRQVELVFRTAGVLQSAPAVKPLADDPMTVSSEKLVYRRDDRLLRLSGGATMRRGRRELRADEMTLQLDHNMRATRLVARDHAVLHSPGADSDLSVSADELAAPLADGGRIEAVVATDHVVLTAKRADGRHQLTAASSMLDLDPASQQARHFTAMGNVEVLSGAQDGSMRRLQTSQLDVYFVDAGQNESRIDRATAQSATLEWGTSASGAAARTAETMRVKGRLLDGSFDQAGELRQLRGTGDVEVQKKAPGDPVITSTSRDLLVSIGPDEQWSTADQSGGVRLKNDSGDARGDHVRFDRAGDSVTLTGSVILTDASSQTRAQTATFRQGSGELRAEGNVSTTEFPRAATGAAPDANAEPTHISSARMVADTAGGHAVYSGKARMWQGPSVIQADTIDLDRPERKLVATGHVSTIFPQAGRASDGPFHPSFWRAEGGRLVYEEDRQHARLDQEAHAVSRDGSMQADQIDVFFAPRPGSTGLASSLESQQVQRAQGLGAVRIESAGRIGTGQRAEYWAAESKFILSGGHPKLIDKFGNSTAGRQLTFFFSDDRIVVDSEEGSRTLTLHRVEK